MDDKIAQFTEITGASAEQAQFFLQSANGDLDTAMSTFFESGGASESAVAGQGSATVGDDEDDDAMDEDVRESLLPSQPQSAAATGGQALGGHTLGGANIGGSSSSFSGATSSASSGSGDKKKAPSQKSRFATLATLSGGGEDSDDKKKPQEWYAGGDRSGINVEDPNARRSSEDDDDLDGPNEMVRNLLKKAAAGSAARSESEEAKKKDKPTNAFGGSGFTLGSSAHSEETAASASAAGPSTGGLGSLMPGGFPSLGSLFGRGARPPPTDGRELPEDYEEESVIRHLTLWRDGFSVEDGPLLRYDDPQHAATFQAIQNGTAPEHILNVRFGQQVELRVAKRTNEDYVPPPKKPAKPFSGSGQTLGSSSTSSAVPSKAASPAPAAAAAPAADSAPFEVDSSKPVTTLQIRLGDGSRVRAQFNQETHTIADIRRYINAGHPGMASRPYVLLTAFPTKELTNESITIKEADLMGSVVTQKFK